MRASKQNVIARGFQAYEKATVYLVCQLLCSVWTEWIDRPYVCSVGMGLEYGLLWVMHRWSNHHTSLLLVHGINWTELHTPCWSHLVPRMASNICIDRRLSRFQLHHFAILLFLHIFAEDVDWQTHWSFIYLGMNRRGRRWVKDTLPIVTVFSSTSATSPQVSYVPNKPIGSCCQQACFAWCSFIITCY